MPGMSDVKMVGVGGLCVVFSVIGRRVEINYRQVP